MLEDQPAARLISLSHGFNNLDDAALLQLVGAMSALGPAVREALLHHAPISAPSAVACGGTGSLTAWCRAFATSPFRCVRLSVLAIPLACQHTLRRAGRVMGW